MQLEQTHIPGCLKIIPEVHKDKRGWFIKTFIRDKFAENNLQTDFSEEYYTFSVKNVVRGLHFQLPPKEITKIVCCVGGSVIDAVVDLRKDSPAYGSYQTFELNSEAGVMLYIPAGLAHGFEVAGDYAVLMYKVTGDYSAAHDAGVLWNSAGIPWKTENPLLSERDQTFPKLNDFKSPFVFNNGGL
jgi:dTDP-4-dehydrorhamnose 3,5-epimerase